MCRLLGVVNGWEGMNGGDEEGCGGIHTLVQSTWPSLSLPLVPVSLSLVMCRGSCVALTAIL